MRGRLAALILLSTLYVSAQDTYSGTRINASALFEKGMNALSGSGFSRSDMDGIKYIRQAAELGYAPAQTALGTALETGVGGPINTGQAAEWYEKAADQGDELAAVCLGRIYYLGSGKMRDLRQARRLLTPAAEHGNAFAQHLLGLIMEDLDYTAAPDWYRKAAEQGLLQAQYKLGLLLRDGRGIPLDRFEAYVWLLLSFEAGNRAAGAEVQALEGDLGSRRVEEAKSKARRMQARINRSVVAGGCTGWSGEFSEVPAPPPPSYQQFCR